jgi:hypothetical protein
MPRISYAFFTLAALCGLAGMVWGIQLGATQDFTTHPAHAHLNLLGWLSLAVMGAFYSLDRGAPQRLAWINFIFSGVGATVLPLGIALLLTGHDKPGELLAMIGGIVALLGMATFLIVVLGGWRRANG